MKRYATGLALSSLVLAIGITHSTFVSADGCSKPEYQVLLKIKNPDDLHKRINELDLTKTQKAQFKTMKDNFDAQEKKSGASLSALGMQIHRMVSSPSIDQAHLDSVLLNLKKDMAISMSQTVIFRHNVYNLLNDTQKAKYHELQQQEHQSSRMYLECPSMVMKANNNLGLGIFNHINELNLTPEQKTKIMPLIMSHQDQAKKYAIQLADSSMGFNEMENQLVQSTSAIDLKKLNEFTTVQANLIEEVEKNRLMTFREIYATLNPQQQVKFMKLKR